MLLLRSLCEELKLPKLLRHYRDLVPQTDRELATAYKLFVDELDEHLFLVIQADRRKYWSSNEWIDKKIRDSFALATQELRAAGTAYACSLSTASVFHAMRAAEYGMRALAKERKVEMPNTPIDWATWEDLIGQIQKKSQEQANSFSKGAKRDAVRNFYSGVLGEFNAFRDEFRNDVMHARASYDDLQALRVLDRVSDFTEKLAERTNEAGKRIKWK